MAVKSYKELLVWQKAMKLVKEIYILTEVLKMLYVMVNKFEVKASR